MIEEVDVLHITGYDAYEETHESGAYIVFNALRDSKYSSSMAILLEKQFVDPKTFFYPYGQHFQEGNKSPQEVAKGLPRHKVLVMYGEDFSPEQIKAIHVEHACQIIWVMMTHDLLSGGCSYPAAPSLMNTIVDKVVMVEGGQEQQINAEKYAQLDIRKESCAGYTKTCGNCPEFKHRPEKDKTRELFLRKEKNFAGLPITIACVSSYSLSLVPNSSLFKTNKTVLLPLPNDVPYCTEDKKDVRQRVGAPLDKKIILWGTTQPDSLRKGKKIMEEVLIHLWNLLEEDERNQIALLQVGPDPMIPFHLTQPFFLMRSGRLPTRAAMGQAYKLADISICTTVSDAGPMMVSESLLNECPVVGFDRSVILDTIDDGTTGHIIKNLDTLEMAKKALELLRSKNLDEISKNARKKAIEYHDLQKVQQKWDDLFKEIIGE